MGNPVTDLEKSDFVLYDEGELKIVTDFERHIFKLEKEIKDTEPDLAQKTSPLLKDWIPRKAKPCKKHGLRSKFLSVATVNQDR